MISINSNQFTAPKRRNFEVVERKGLGHPDTMADLIAEQFSHLYSTYCRDNFGQVLNHAVDKVTLVGASTKVRFGGFDVIAPVQIFLIGKVAPAVGSLRIPIHDLFRRAVEEVVSFTLIDDSILRHTSLQVVNTFSAPTDRSQNFYLPASEEQALSIGTNELGANDTVFCTGSAGQSPLEELVLNLELAVTSPANRRMWPTVGTDVKVMAVRQGDNVDATICIPTDPVTTTNRHEYDQAIDHVRQVLEQVSRSAPFDRVELNINTKDTDSGVYLAPFGTSLGKSDCGAVGRGNKHAGFISAFRPANVEAPCGKNPLHHAGRLYTVAAQRIADGLFTRNGIDSAVTIVARNGADLDEPAYISVDLDGNCETPETIEEAAHSVTRGISEISAELVARNPLSTYQAEAEAKRLVPLAGTDA